MTFIASFLLVCSVSLVVRDQNDNDIPIEQCVKNVVKTAQQDNGQIKKRPNIDPSSCLDLDAGSCTLFALRQQDNYAINLPSINIIFANFLLLYFYFLMFI